MTTYSFDTITAAQAAAFGEADTLGFGQGSATDVAVFYASPSEIDIVLGGRTVAFGANVAAASQVAKFAFADGSSLLIGDDAANTLKNATAIFGGGGEDTISAGSLGHTLVQANAGNDVITTVSSGLATVYGGQGDDRVTLFGLGPELTHAVGANFVQGNKGNDTLLVLGSDSNTILGGQGDDTIQGGSGSEFLNGNLGNDSIISTGNDLVFGEGGNDNIQGGVLSTVHGGDGDDVLTGGAFVFGDLGNDTVGGGPLHLPQTLDGGDGDDFVFSRLFGQATEFGGAGNDTLSGLSGPDTMDGGTGDDRLVSNVGGDIMVGGDGADTFVAVGASNQMSGGPGADRFELGAGTLTAAGVDKITDWSVDDVLHFTNLPGPIFFSNGSASDFDGALALASQAIAAHPGVVAVQVGGDVIVFAGGGSVDVAVELVGRSLADIAPGNIV